MEDILEVLYNILPLLENTAWWKIQKSTKIKMEITQFSHPEKIHL